MLNSLLAGFLTGSGVTIFILIVMSIVRDTNSCDLGHKLPKVKHQAPIFYEIVSPGSAYEFAKPYSYCKRCGKKVEYNFLMHKETDENIQIMSVSGYDKFYKAIEEGDNK